MQEGGLHSRHSSHRVSMGLHSRHSSHRISSVLMGIAPAAQTPVPRQDLPTIGSSG